MRVGTVSELEDSAQEDEILWMENQDQEEFVVDIKNEKEIELIGGKAFNISWLARKVSPGFQRAANEYKIPEGVCITTEAYDSICRINGLRDKIARVVTSINYEDTVNIREASKKIREIILEAKVPVEISEKLSSIPYNNLIVRSSANLEDLPDASFAGQQATFVNPQNLEDAVKKCWASLWTERALSYRHHRSIAKIPKIAVIIQEVIPCDFSGVAFTKNPVTHDDEIVIEVVPGLGDPLVSGKVQPDRYVLDSQMHLRRKEVTGRKYKVVLAEAGREEVRTEKKEFLTEEMLKKIGKISLRIENAFQKPQDIEFGVYNNEVYIFQSRDITTRKEDVWTRGLGDDYWGGVTSPLHYSLIGEFMEVYVNQEKNRIMGYTELEGVPLLRYHKAHVYFNTRVLMEVFKYSPKFSRVKELLDYLPEHERDEMKRLPFSIYKRILAQLRACILDWDGMIFNTYRKFEKFSKKCAKQLAQFDEVNLEALSDSEIIESYRHLHTIFLKHYRLIRWGVTDHSFGMDLILKSLITSWYGEDPDRTHTALLSGLPENKTTETNLALFNLVKAKKEGKCFEKELEEFLKEYGHRSYSRDIIFPRWAENPDLVVDIVNTLLENDRDIQEIEAEKRERMEEITRRVIEKIEKQRYGFFRKQVFKIVLFYVQKYIGFRENQRFILDCGSYRFKKIFLEIGRRLEERKILENRRDVFFLFKAEVFEALESGEVDLELLEKRKKEFKEYEDKLPPKFLQGNWEFDEDKVHEREFCGVASGPGVVKGRVKLIGDIRELHKIKKGEIMVAACTDPGWTPVFLKINGLITETGGILSHGAVVSREYGIPAVTGVKNAMTLLKDGDIVVLDGNLGKIYVG